MLCYSTSWCFCCCFVVVAYNVWFQLTSSILLRLKFDVDLCNVNTRVWLHDDYNNFEVSAIQINFSFHVLRAFFSFTLFAKLVWVYRICWDITNWAKIVCIRRFRWHRCFCFSSSFLRQLFVGNWWFSFHFISHWLSFQFLYILTVPSVATVWFIDFWAPTVFSSNCFVGITQWGCRVPWYASYWTGSIR